MALSLLLIVVDVPFFFLFFFFFLSYFGIDDLEEGDLR